MFKLYLSDTGILTSMSEIKYQDIVRNKAFDYKGAITENYIAQEFVSREISLYYWTYGRSAEVDFLIYNNDGIIPVEIKSGDNVNSPSLNVYIRENKPKYAIRISGKNFGFENNIKSVPLYAAFCVE
jgi:predicted AAA+ superfamily ATPase